jgi:hypothetical protein
VTGGRAFETGTDSESDTDSTALVPPMLRDEVVVLLMWTSATTNWKGSPHVPPHPKKCEDGVVRRERLEGDASGSVKMVIPPTPWLPSKAQGSVASAASMVWR